MRAFVRDSERDGEITQNIFFFATKPFLLKITGKLVLALRVAVRFDIFFIIIRFLFYFVFVLVPPLSEMGK